MDSTKTNEVGPQSTAQPSSSTGEVLHPINDEMPKPPNAEMRPDTTGDEESISASNDKPNRDDSEIPTITNGSTQDTGSDARHKTLSSDQRKPNPVCGQHNPNTENDQLCVGTADDDHPNCNSEPVMTSEGRTINTDTEALLANPDGVLPSSNSEPVNDSNTKDVDSVDSHMSTVVLRGSDEMVADKALAKKERFANIKLFMVNYSMLLLFYMSQNIYNIGVIRTIERKYGLRSSQSGFIMSMNDISHILVVVFVGYFGKKTHKPRYMSISLLLCAVAAFLMATPYFIFGESPTGLPTPTPLPPSIALTTHPSYSTNAAPYDGVDHDELMTAPGLCDADRPDVECTQEQVEQDSANMAAYYIMLTAQFISGAGGAGITTLGFSYIDENTPTHKSALYIGMVSSMFSFAPVVALMVAAMCLKFPENPTSNTTLTPDDPQWIGCWWMGYVICAVGIILSCIPMWFFPKTIIKRAKSDEQIERDSMSIKRQLKDFPKCTMSLLTNLPYMMFVLMTVLLMYVVTGLYSNLPRYIEVHFLKPAFVASFVAISGAAAGIIGGTAGGLVMNKKKLKPKGAMKILVISSAIMCVSVAVSMALGCPQLQMAGIWNEDGELAVETPCNQQCSCPTTGSAYQPVCGQDGLTYFSPCHAACKTSVNGTYSGCGCVPPSNSTSPSGTVEPGTCGVVCNMLIPYIIMFGISALAGSVCRAPSAIVLFRIVGDEQRSFALGISSFMSNLLAFIPAPVIFGAIVDSTCVLWSDTCSGTGSCLLYDSKKFRLAIHGSALCFKVLAFICTVIIYILIKDMKFKEHGEATDVNCEKEQQLNNARDDPISEIKLLDEKSSLGETEAVV